MENKAEKNHRFAVVLLRQVRRQTEYSEACVIVECIPLFYLYHEKTIIVAFTPAFWRRL